MKVVKVGTACVIDGTESKWYVVLAGKRASLKMCLSVLNSSEACQLLIAIQSKSDMKVNFFKMKIFTPTIQKV